MAAGITHALATPLTTNVASYVSGSFTPAAHDLLVVFVVCSGQTTGTGTLTSSLGGSYTFTPITQAAKAASADRLYAFVANRTSNAVAQTVTFAPSSAATGCVIEIVRVSGISRVGLAAIKQSAVANNGAAAAAPAVTFSTAVTTSNPTLVFAANAANPATLTPPTNWTEQNDTGYATPTTGAEYASRLSGFAATTVTWAATSATAWGAIGLEIDASDGPAISTLTEDFAAGTMNAAKWAVYSPGQSAEVSQASGALVISPGNAPSTYNGYGGVPGFALTGSSIYVKVPDPFLEGAPGNGDSDLLLTHGDTTVVDTRYSLAFYTDGVSGSLLVQRLVFGAATTMATIPYDATNHAWVRVRHDSAGNRVHWETSPDGVTFTSQYNEAPPIPTGWLRVALVAGTYSASASAGSVTFDNVNVAGGAPSHPASGALAAQPATLSGTAVHRTKHTASGTLAGRVATLTATAAHRKTHPASGSLVAQAAQIAGTAAHKTRHTATGTLVARPAVLAGVARHVHSALGILLGRAALLSGTAAHRKTHTASGALLAQAAQLNGSAVHPHRVSTASLLARPALIGGAASRTGTHLAFGALLAQPAQVSAVALRIDRVSNVHNVSGSLDARAAQLSGTAAHRALHTASGSLIAGPAQAAGAALRPHVASAQLSASAAQISGAANRIGAPVTHAASGSLIAQRAALSGTSRIGDELPPEQGGAYPGGIDRFDRTKIDHRITRAVLKARAASIEGHASHSPPPPRVIDKTLANERRKTAALTALLLARGSGRRIATADD